MTVLSLLNFYFPHFLHYTHFLISVQTLKNYVSGILITVGNLITYPYNKFLGFHRLLLAVDSQQLSEFAIH